ncbi:MAG: hypothetical protein ACI835_005536 [Planctomycetota bacterium]|jgi:hypothetical protein
MISIQATGSPRWAVLVGATLLVLLCLSPFVSARTCMQSWQPTLGENPGVDDDATALAVFDDGSGDALYVAGGFGSAGSVAAEGIARWDGDSWSSLAGGSTNDTIIDLLVFDDGSGDTLYACGSFTMAGGVGVNRVAKWDGTTWSPLGGGLNLSAMTMAVYDDGGGAALHVAGAFTSAGGTPASRIAKWDGTAWSGLGGGLGGTALDLAVYDDGGGEDLYATGYFTMADGVPASYIAQWDGSTWSEVGGGLNTFGTSLQAFDDGSGPELFVGGAFTMAGGISASRVVKWDGSSWTALGTGIGGNVGEVAVVDLGSPGGPSLFVGGAFSTAGGLAAAHIAEWNGSSWQALSGGLSFGDVGAIVGFSDGTGPALFAGGGFMTSVGATLKKVGRWDGSSWSSLGSGIAGIVRALAVYDAGTGPELYIGGNAASSGGAIPGGVVKWDGSNLSSVGASVGLVHGLCVADIGSGELLYAVGDVYSDHGVSSWDGSTWATVGGGVDSIAVTARVHAVTAFDDGAGMAIYIGGEFDYAGGGIARNIAKWDGSSWSSLGTGIANGTNYHVYSLFAHDDGSGSALYVGGSFSSAGGVTAFSLAKWNGTSWSGVGPSSGPGTDVHAMATFDDGLGSGSQLYVAGDQGVRRWNGLSWSFFGHLNSYVRALEVYDDGSGLALFVGGVFSTAGGVQANSLARWDGSNWSGFGSEMNGYVLDLASYDDGSGAGTSLFTGGSFTTSAARDSYLAHWGQGCTGVCGVSYCTSTPNSTSSPAVISATGSASVAANDLTLRADSVPDQPGLFYYGPQQTTVPFGNGTRCVAGMVARLSVVNATGGVMTWLLDNTSPPSPPTQITAGSTWNFQAWFRDPGAGGQSFDLSDALSITFQP